MKKNITHNYLMNLSKIQKDILVVYHPTRMSSWRDRCLFNSEEYNPKKRYNHRSILKQEVVIEYDETRYKVNKEYADIICGRLRKDTINYSQWKSGNKSVHVHFMVDIGEVKNLQLLKKVIMRHYTEDLPVPDLRLASNNHLIRTENGRHEKTGKNKSLIIKSPRYPQINKLPEVIWGKYYKVAKQVINRKTTITVNELIESPKIKYILTSEKFRNHDDGRERALFMLIHILKSQYENDKKGLIKYLQEWYRYSGGRSLTDYQVECKINYHWNKHYTFGENYVNELLESIGVNPEKINSN